MKKILFFATMFVVALCSAALVSCGDDDEEETKGYPYSVEFELTADVMKAYDNIMVTVQTPDGPAASSKLSGTKYTTSGVTSKRGTIKVTVSGNVRADIDNDASFNIGIDEKVRVPGHLDLNTFTKIYKGAALKADYSQLADYPSMTHSLDF